MRKTKTLWFTVFAVIIALTMAATVFLAAGFAEDAPEDGFVLIDGNLGATEGVDNVALYYNASTKTAKFSGEGRIKDFKPGGAYFRDTSNLPVKDAENVIIEDGIKNISEHLFLSSKIKSAIIPNSVTEIGAYAFKNCHSLESLTIPETVTSIGDYAFNYCDSLCSLTLPGCSYGSNMIGLCSSLEEVVITEGATVIPDNMFAELPIKSIALPNSLQTIGHDAFKNCVNLETVSIPSATGTIDCFTGCTALEEITLPEGVTALGYRYDYDSLWIHQHELYCAFKDCVNLKRVTLPGTLAQIDKDSFSGCAALVSVVFAPGSMANIPAECFAGCTALSEVVLPDKMTSIGEYAFDGCAGLSEITLPESVGFIGRCAFQFCTGLSEITVPERVVFIDYGTFQVCTSLTKITLPSGLTVIPEHAFFGCAALQQIGFGAEDTPADGRIVFPSGLTSIGNWAFYDCVRLTALSFPQSVVRIGQSAFEGCDNLEELRFCRNELIVGENAFPTLHGADIYTCFGYEWEMRNHFKVNTTQSFYFSGEYTVIGHAHEIVYMPKEKTTSTSAGMKAHYECTRCGALFEDADGVSEKPYDYFVPKSGPFFSRFLQFFRKIIQMIQRLFSR